MIVVGPDTLNARRQTLGSPSRGWLSVTVLPAGSEPGGDGDSAEGTPSDWLPGIRDEHEDSTGWQAQLLDRPTWDRTVTPNIRRRQGTRPPRRRR